MALFAVISEPFYYFAFGFEPSVAGLFGNLAQMRFTNVFFTLFLGVLAVYIYKLTAKYGVKSWIIAGITAVFLSFAAGFFKTDYGAMGVLLIAALYLTRGRRGVQCAVVALWAAALYSGGYLLTSGLSGALSGFEEALGACLACIPIMLYNGERGRRMKWTFYVYYPAHLLVLTLIDRALTG